MGFSWCKTSVSRRKIKAVSSFLTAVKKLTEVFPQLLDKLRRVEQKAPANNISSSIQRIRELIAQTRSVASKVKLLDGTFGY